MLHPLSSFPFKPDQYTEAYDCSIKKTVSIEQIFNNVSLNFETLHFLRHYFIYTFKTSCTCFCSILSNAEVISGLTCLGLGNLNPNNI